MRIAFFSDSYHPHVSGVVQSMDLTARYLREHGHDVTVVTPAHPEAPAEPEPRVMRVPSLPAGVYPSLRIGLPIALWRGRPPFDVLHAHSPFTMGLAAVRLGLRHGLPVVFTVHSLYDEYVRYLPLSGEGARAAVRSYVTALLNRCDAVIAPSRHVLAALREWGVERPVSVIPTGVDREALRKPAATLRRHHLGLPEGAFLWLYVGRLAPEKEVEFLLRAFQHFLAAHPEARFLVVGDGPDRERLQELVGELGLRQRVVMPGALAFAQVAACYHAADLFVYACRVDTQGLVLAEAGAAGLPCLAVGSPAAAEVLIPGVTGLIAPPDPAGFAALAVQYAGDPALRQRLRSGCARHGGAWGASESAARVEKLYEQLLRSVKVAR